MMRPLLLAVVLASIGCAPAKPVQAPTPVAAPPATNRAWQSKLDVESALVGKIWDVERRAFITLAQLGEALAKSRFALLGEKHDNPDHHVLQGELITRLVQHGRRPAVVLEMLETQQQPAIDEYLARAGASAAGFGEALAWEKTSWPPYVEYRPVLEAAFAAKLSIVAGNVAHADAKALVKQGTAALPEAQVRAFRLDQPFPPALESSLTEELRASHCGHLPEKLLAPMALAQRARDASMAQQLARAGAADGAVLIAGGGHVRRDRGVPYYLAFEAPGQSVTSVLLREVRHGDTDPENYLEEEGPFDYVWFTPRVSDEDPCAAFRKP